jgi:hypothetical protein
MVRLVDRKPWLLRPLAMRLLPPPVEPPQPDLSWLRTVADVRNWLAEASLLLSRGKISPAEAGRLARRARRRLREIRKERRLFLRLAAGERNTLGRCPPGQEGSCRRPR